MFEEASVDCKKYFTLKSSTNIIFYHLFIMTSNYLKVALRNMIKSKAFSAINILGLSVSLAACLIIVIYVSFELSFDNYHENSSRIYRLRMDVTSGTLHAENASTYPVVKNLIENQLPEISQVVRVKQKKGIIISDEGRGHSFAKFSEDNILYVDEAFFQVFSFPLIAGDMATALSNPNSVVITASMARKYFGNTTPYDDIIGRVIQKIGSSENEVLSITGICKDVPKNSHFTFDFLITYKSIHGWRDDDGEDYKRLAEHSFEWPGFYTYILVDHELSTSGIRALEKRITNFFVNNLLETKQSQQNYQFLLQPIKEIHLRSHLNGEYLENGNMTNVYLLTIVGFLLLSMALLNYVSLSSSKASERFKEVGVRKVLGSDRKEIIVRFFIEALLISSISTTISIIFFWITFSTLKTFIYLEFYQVFGRDATFYVFIILSFLLSTAIYLVYPLISLTNVSPIAGLRGGFLHIKGGRLRSFLVVFQFFVASLLIAGSLTAYKQMTFMKGADVGIKIDDMLILKAPKVPSNREKYLSTNEAFKTELGSFPSIKNVTTGVRIPGEEMATQRMKLVDSQDTELLVNIIGVDQDYLNTFGLKPIAGRNFAKTADDNPELRQFNELRVNFGSNDHSIIINESASRLLGFQNHHEALGQYAYLFGAKKVIIGVVSDYHHQSVKERVKPTVFYIQHVYSNYYILRIEKSTNVSHLISLISQSWNKFYPKDPFEYFFLDDFYNQQYKKDDEFQKVFASFTVLTVFIACLGLLALSLSTIARRSKEIAVRKVVGASTTTIVTGILGDFIRLILISLTLSTPISFVLYSQWLENFPVRISLGLWFVWSPALIIFLLTIFMVIYQTVTAARHNPIKYLRYE